MNRQHRRGSKPELFAQAVAFHQSGNIANAERLYRRILAANPAHVAALSNLGLAALTQGRPDDAVAALRRAVALGPDNAQAVVNLAEALRAMGALEDALAAYRSAVALMPPSALLQNNIGVVLSALGRPLDAIAAFNGATGIDPTYADAHANAGRLKLQAGELTDAVAALRRANALRPDVAEYLADLGLALTQLGDFAAGEAACRAAIVRDPAYVPAHINLAHALVQQRQYAETIMVCEAALVIAPHNADLLCSRAAAALMTGAIDTAEQSARAALGVQPRHVAAWFNLGMTLERRGALDGALTAQRAALAIDPGFAGAELKMAHALLALGDYENGWRHFEARWRTAEHVSNFQHIMARPRWLGEKLAGRTILLHWEQGLGDTLQLLRYVPMVAARGGQVQLLVQQALQTVVPDWPGVTLVTDPADLPAFDVQCSLFSLPACFGTMPAAIPAAIPYLRGQSDTLSQRYRAIPDRATDGAVPKVRVGLVWAGSADHKGDAARSIALPLLAPLLAVPGVRFFSLQRDLRDGDADFLSDAGRHVTQLGPELHDFADTAAALSAVDMLMTVDTSVCHLAGALGVPVWLLLPFSPEWRWAIDQSRSRWYPSVQLWRQTALGDWAGLIARVALALATLRPKKEAVLF